MVFSTTHNNPIKTAITDIKKENVPNPVTELCFTLISIKSKVKNILKTETAYLMILVPIIFDLSYKNLQNQKFTEKFQK